MQEQFTLRNGSVVLIREAEERDAAALAAFFRRCGGESDFLSFGAEDCPYDETRALGLIRTAAEQPDGTLLLAFENGEPVAELSLIIPDRKRFSHKAELGIAVAQRLWQQGLGSHLMALALQHGKNHGLDSIFLTVSAENKVGIRLYERFGFTEYGRYRREAFFRGAYHDALLMSCYLSDTQK